MAAPPELALEEQASSRKAAGATRVDDAVGWPPGWVLREQRESHRRVAPQKGLDPTSQVLSSPGRTGSQAHALLAWEARPGHGVM